jgi:4-diphosphocytidyl-2-C-methyl-D-erythritol kinase
MISRLRVDAPCKVNPFLRVLAREDTGYHRIETVFQALELADTLEFEVAEEGIELAVEGAELGPTEDNLVFRAAKLFFHESGQPPGVRIRLEKRIPTGSGLGGGSSDAAATLRALNHMYEGPLAAGALVRHASTLGSDVPFFLVPTGFALGWGRGTRLLQLPAPPPRPVLVVLTGVHISTPEAYGALSAGGLAASRGRVLETDALTDWTGLIALAENDFEGVVFSVHPELGAIRDELAAQGAELARLSGSGSAVFAVFEETGAAETAARAVEATFSTVTVVQTRTATALCDLEPQEG